VTAGDLSFGRHVDGEVWGGKRWLVVCESV
jgi:hypothetical protein